MDPLLAMIVIFGGNYAPEGWAYCQGQMMSLSQNPALYSLLGVTYGGNGQTTFGLPDLRGRAPIGIGQAPGLNPVNQGEMGGVESVTLTISNMPMHTHTVINNLQVTPPASSLAGTSNVPGPTMMPAALPALGTGPSASTVKGYSNTGNTTMQPIPVTGSSTVGIAGGSSPMSVRDPYLGVNYIIAVQGIFPPRP